MLKQEKDFDPVEKLPEQIDNESSNNEVSESIKDTVNETKGPSSKNEIKDELPNEEEKANNSDENLETKQKKNTISSSELPSYLRKSLPFVRSYKLN